MKRGNSSEVCSRKPWNTNEYTAFGDDLATVLLAYWRVQKPNWLSFSSAPGKYACTAPDGLLARVREVVFLPIGGRGAIGACLEAPLSSYSIPPPNGCPRGLPHTLTGLLAAHNVLVLERERVYKNGLTLWLQVVQVAGSRSSSIHLPDILVGFPHSRALPLPCNPSNPTRIRCLHLHVVTHTDHVYDQRQRQPT
jgi:hypothetical protein